MQIKTLVRYYFFTFVLANITQCDNTGKGLRKQVFLVDEGINWSELCVEPLAVLIKIANVCTV